MVALPGSIERAPNSHRELSSQLRAYLVSMLVIVVVGGLVRGITGLLHDTLGDARAGLIVVRAIVMALLAFGFWAVRRFPDSTRLHRTVDAAVPFVLSMAPVLGLLRQGDTAVSVDLLVLAAAVALCLRAALVSSTARRTVLVGLLALAPVLILAPFITTPGRPTFIVFASAFKWSLAVLIATAVMSHVVYGLRQQLRLGPYELGRKLGEGGMGIVYEAKHALLRRRTAVKFIRDVGVNSEEARRFEREAQITSALSHPNIVSLFDYGCTPDGVYYYAMEFIDGLSLHQVVTRYGPLPPGRAVHVLRQVAAALEHAHDAGLIHRDIKAANVMLCRAPGSEDLVKVLDFGLAKEIDVDDGITRAGGVVGTPTYLAPEVIWGDREAGKTSYVYAFGVLAYYMLTGEAPFVGETTAQVAYSHAVAMPVPPSLRTSNVLPAIVDDLVLRCLAKDPELRFADGADLCAEMSGWDDMPEWTRSDVQAWWLGPGSLLAMEQEADESRRFSSTKATVAQHKSVPRPAAADPTAPLLLSRKPAEKTAADESERNGTQ